MLFRQYVFVQFVDCLTTYFPIAAASARSAK